MTALIPALIAALFGLLIIVGVASLFVRALFGFNLQGYFKRFLARRERKLFEEIDRLVAAKDQRAALTLIESGFQFRSVQKLDAIQHQLDHNLAVLGKLVMIAEGASQEIEGLPVLEELFEVRSELMRALSEAELKSQSLSKRAHAPSWGAEEFERKIKDIRDRITTNQRTVEEQISRAVRSLTERGQGDGITYH